MASTYSTDLRLELIGQGEQPNLWGLTTNNNLGGLLEQAIAGTAFVVMPLDADYTLVAADGVVDQARAAILNITSATALTVPRTIVAPAVQKLYVVYNGTTGGQSILVQTSTAGLAVSIPNGYSKIIGCDGNNFYESLSAASQILLGGNPVLPLQAATKQYVDTAAGAGPTYYAGLPLMNGIADPGLSGQYAGGTHVHPTDTTRAPLFNPAFTGSAASFPGTLTIGGLVAAPQLLVANVPSLANEVVSLGFADGRYAILNGTPPFAQVALTNPATAPNNAVRLQEFTATLGNYAVLTPAGSTNTFTNTNVFQGVTQVPTPTDAQVSSSTNVQYVLNKIAAATAGVSSVNVSAGTPLSAVPTTGNVILNITKANATTNGYLASGDFTTFSSKVSSLSAGTGISVSNTGGGVWQVTNTSPGGGGGGGTVTSVSAGDSTITIGGTASVSPTVKVTPNTYVRIVGDTMTGLLTLKGAGTSATLQSYQVAGSSGRSADVIYGINTAFGVYGCTLNTNSPNFGSGSPGFDAWAITQTNQAFTSPIPRFAIGTGGSSNVYGNLDVWPDTYTGTQVGDIVIKQFLGGGVSTATIDNNGTIIRTVSDESFKENVKTITGGLDKVLGLNPVTFDWIDKERFGSKRSMGFIAQQAQAFVPEVIGKNPDKTLSLDYAPLVSLLTSAIQELKSELDAVKAELALLKG